MTGKVETFVLSCLCYLLNQISVEDTQKCIFMLQANQKYNQYSCNKQRKLVELFPTNLTYLTF